MRYLIIGGSRGIGRVLTEELLDGGHEVWVGSREQGDTPSGAHWFPFDARKDQLPASVTDQALDGLAYLPGSIVLKPFRSLTADQFQDDFELNVLGAVRVLQMALPALKKSSRASVVLFSTVAATQGMPFHASIATAKAGVEGLTRSLAAEWAPGIRVNALAPSLTDTALAEKLLSSPSKREAAAHRHPLQRVGLPQDLASLAAFLLHPEHSWITGQVLAVDGGMSTLRV
jgi:3-oxoacyl-[acyl-carrier protein] reductase